MLCVHAVSANKLPMIMAFNAHMLHVLIFHLCRYTIQVIGAIMPHVLLFSRPDVLLSLHCYLGDTFLNNLQNLILNNFY